MQYIRLTILTLTVLPLMSCAEQVAEHQVVNMKPSDFALSVEHVRGEVDGEPVETEMKTYSSKLTVWDRTVDISFDPDNVESDLDTFVAILSEQAQWIAASRSQIEDSIIGELLELKNSTWLEEGQKSVSRAQFLKAIVLTDITFRSDGSFEMYFDDGDLFFGHTILLSGSKDKGIDSATIAG